MSAIDWDEVIGTKLCKYCNETKSMKDFVKNNKLPTGREGRCRECLNTKNRNRYKTEPEYRQRLFDNVKADRKRRENYHVAKTYGISLDEFQEMLEDQDGLCLICDREFDEEIRPCVDHNHKCCPGRNKTCGLCIRGIICIYCNARLNTVEDTNWLAKANWYLNIYEEISTKGLI